MKIIVKVFLLQLLLNTTAYAHLCEDKAIVASVLKQAKIRPSEDALLDCKVDPENASQMIMAYALWQPDHADEGIGSYQLNILKFQKDNLKVNFTFADHNEFDSDAMVLDSIHLDTANYKIMKNNRALGVRLDYVGQSRANPWSFSLLNLYNLNNKKRVLDRFIVKQYLAETDTRCNADVEERRSTLIMQNKTSNQVFDIQVSSKIEHYQSRGTVENCKDSKHKLSGQNFILKFDGQQYQIPQQFKADYEYQ